MLDNQPQNPTYRYVNHFEIVRADTPFLLDEAYRLRYQVYCLEKGFIDPAAHPDGREIDLDDGRSVHALLRHRQTGAYAGTVRVIMPGRGSQRLLPTERVLADQRCRAMDGYPRHKTAEVSRFVVSKRFRRRPGEEHHPDVAEPQSHLMPGERRTAPHITFGLIRAVLEICTEHRITHLCAVMDPALIRILGRFGLDFVKIGDPVDHRGMLQPCVARLEDLIARNYADATPLWEYTNAALDAATSRCPVAA